MPILQHMSANELIQQIKALPEQEQREVYDFVITLRSDEKAGETKTFEQAADAVFRKHDELLRMLAK